MAITLPSASLRMINTGAQRVRTGRATEARDVRPVPPDRDPGVRMPNIPTGGFEALAKGLSIFADIKARQQKAFDSNAVTAIERQAQRKFNEEAQRRKREGAVALDEVVADDDPDPVIDATHPDFYADAVNFSESLIASEVARLPRGVSDSAKTDLRNRLFSQATTFAKAMGDYSLDQTEKQTSDNIDAIGRTSSDEVLFNPQNVDIERGKAQTRLDAFEGLGDPNMLRDKRREVDQDIIKGAINGYVNDQEFDKAHALLERLGKELNPGDQNALGRLIDRKEESARTRRQSVMPRRPRKRDKSLIPPVSRMIFLRVAATGVPWMMHSRTARLAGASLSHFARCSMPRRHQRTTLG